jgi:hypothetical protein
MPAHTLSGPARRPGPRRVVTAATPAAHGETAPGGTHRGTSAFGVRAADVPGQRPASDPRPQAVRQLLAEESGTAGVLAAVDRRRDADERQARDEAADQAEAERQAEAREVAANRSAEREQAAPDEEEAAAATQGAEAAVPLAEVPAPPVTAYPDTLDGWIREALDIMAREGIPGTYDGLYRNIMRESSGNPDAINLWDINAINGTPSIGLLQVIQPTFDAYHVEGTPYDIYDPVANIVAAANYAADRYGSIDNVNGPY